MKIDTTFVVPSAAVVSSVLLLLAGKQRVFEVLALAASAAWLLLELSVFEWPLQHKFASPGIVGASRGSFSRVNARRRPSLSNVIATG